ncbi:YunG family protein [Kineococcus arenarius]|uniref:YunG family protein n=1 Tax=unclassified Kineococcus TaxID=2621656 RepID=UPI003D7E3F4D
MPTLTLSAIEAAVRASWGPDTCFASADYMARGSGQPSRGQCGTTALVLQELLGGDLMVADVEYEGRVGGVHYWNVTAGGVELDLTRDQFSRTESLINVRRVTTRRNPGGLGEQPFQLLRERVTAALQPEASASS